MDQSNSNGKPASKRPGSVLWAFSVVTILLGGWAYRYAAPFMNDFHFADSKPEAAERGGSSHSSTALTKAVREKITLLFQPEDQARVIELLEARCGANLPLMKGLSDQAFDRIRFAVLKLSEGNLARLESQIEGANRDWRDTLMAAGFGEDATAHLRWQP